MIPNMFGSRPIEQYNNLYLRPLLPASMPDGRGALILANQSTSSPLLTTRKRRQATTAACGACRKRKSKCNAERPKCSICNERGTDCVYDTNVTETHTQALKRKFSELQSQKTTYQKIYEILQLRPEVEADEIYQRIRRGTDADSVLRHINYGDVLVEMSLVPEMNYRYEFPYQRDMPSSLRVPDNPYLASKVYAMAFHSQSELPLPSSPKRPGSATDERGPYLKPYHAAEIVDTRLDTVKPSRWTTVSSDDALMRKLMQLYFLYEYDWFTFFHKDFFLQDMVDGRRRFCSELLVNALLAYSCHCYRGFRDRAEYWNPKNLGYQFLAEAKRLWEVNSERERLPKETEEAHELRMLVTLQAALLLNAIYNMNGSDKIGYRYTGQAVSMARDINLFNKSPESADEEVAHVRNYTAWALFSWQSLNSYHYFSTPLLTQPPKPPLTDPVLDPNWYGENLVRYPMSHALCPTYHGLLFKAKADFWTIVNEFSLDSSSGTGSESRSWSSLPPDRVLWYHERLKSWYDALPEPLTPVRIVLPHQLKIHMQYHLILINILKPLVQQEREHSNRHWNLVVQDPPLFMALKESKISLETLIRLYYLRHGFESLDSFLLQFLGLLTQMTIEAVKQYHHRLQLAHFDHRACDITNSATTNNGNHPISSPVLEDLLSTLILGAKGIYDQGRNHHLAKAVLRLQLSKMRPEDRELLRHFLPTERISGSSRDKERDRRRNSNDSNNNNNSSSSASVSEQQQQQKRPPPIVSDWPAYCEGVDEDPALLRLGNLFNQLDLEELDLGIDIMEDSRDTDENNRKWRRRTDSSRDRRSESCQNKESW